MINVLTDRQLLILQVIIDDFISTAQPVGSRSLSKKENITFSSATIRNEMADLEESGFIEKTHSSSGRVPSEKGYRFYVDHLLSPQKLKRSEILRINSLFAEKIYELENIVQKSAKILSDFFKRELSKFDVPELHPLGRKIIACCMSDGTVDDFVDQIRRRNICLPD